MLVAGIEFPDKCPEKCPEKDKPFYQGNLCSRCPIFNCSDFDGFRLIEPEDYREDWAKAWKKWFDEGMKGYPELCLELRFK